MRFLETEMQPETCKAQGGRTLTNSPSHPREAEAERATPARVRGGNSCEAHTDMFFTRGLLLLASLAVVKVSACVPRLAAAQLLDFSACVRDGVCVGLASAQGPACARKVRAFGSFMPATRGQAGRC